MYEAVTRYGQLNILVNNAGITIPRVPTEEVLRLRILEDSRHFLVAIVVDVTPPADTKKAEKARAKGRRKI